MTDPIPEISDLIPDSQLIEDVNALARYVWSKHLNVFAEECFPQHLTVKMPAYHEKIYSALASIVLTPPSPPKALEIMTYPSSTSLTVSDFPMMKDHISDEIKNEEKLDIENLYWSEVSSGHGDGAMMEDNIVDRNVEGSGDVVVVEPREFGKSTKAMIYVMWTILNKYKKFIIYISKSFDHAVKLVGPIKREFESNEMLREVYGDLMAEKWTESEMEFSNGSKLLALGRGQTVRGLKFLNWRPDLVVLDDIEDDDSVNNSDLRLKLQEWLDKQVLPGVDSRSGNVSVFGTILHPDSLLANISSGKNRLEKYKGFRALFFKALENDRSIWEEKFSTAQLLEEKRKDPYAFAQERMNEPIPLGAGMFKREYFKYFTLEDGDIMVGDRRLKLSDCNLYMTCDIAMTTKEYSDYTVLLVSAVSPQNQIYFLEYTRQRWEDPDKIIDEMFRLHSKYPGIHASGVEEVAAQRWLIVNLRKEMEKRDYFFSVRGLKADKDKLRRISQLQPRFENGSVFLRNFMTEMEEEFLLFPKSPKDDVMDAAAYLLQLAKPGDLEELPVGNRKRPGYKFLVDGEEVIEKLRTRGKNTGVFKEYQTDETFDPYVPDDFELAMLRTMEDI